MFYTDLYGTNIVEGHTAKLVLFGVARWHRGAQYLYGTINISERSRVRGAPSTHLW